MFTLLDRWRLTFVQCACIAAVYGLAITPTPDREMKIAALMIIGMLAAATVSRAKLDGVVEAIGKGGGPGGASAIAALAGVLTAQSIPPPKETPQSPPHKLRSLSWGGVFASLSALVVLAWLLSGCPSSNAGPGSVVKHNAELGDCNRRALELDAGVGEKRAAFLQCRAEVNRRHGVTPDE